MTVDAKSREIDDRGDAEQQASGGYDGLEGIPLPRVVGKPKRFLTHDQVQALMRP
jgi:hypothetical protein